MWYGNITRVLLVKAVLVERIRYSVNRFAILNLGESWKDWENKPRYLGCLVFSNYNYRLCFLISLPRRSQSYEKNNSIWNIPDFCGILFERKLKERNKRRTPPKDIVNNKRKVLNKEDIKKLISAIFQGTICSFLVVGSEKMNVNAK